MISRNERERRELLQKVFREFDYDRGGVIEAHELLRIGQMRRKLGHQSGTWSEEDNARLLRRMDVNGDGKIQQHEFVNYMHAGLPQEWNQFSEIIRQYMDAARALRQQHAAPAPAPAPVPVLNTPPPTAAMPDAAHGWLWKKGGGKSIFGRRNWKQRYFKIAKGVVREFQKMRWRMIYMLVCSCGTVKISVVRPSRHSTSRVW